MKTNFMKKVLGTALAGVMAFTLIPTAAWSVSAATADSEILTAGKGGDIYNTTLYQYALNKYDTNGDNKLSRAEANRVTSLNITGDKMTSVSGIDNFPNLESLTIQNCGLATVNADIGKLSKLKYLNLSYNKIKTLPTSVSGLKNLVTADFSGNKLTALPTNAKYWTKLTTLDLSNNSFVQVSTGSMPYMKSLTTLNMANNKMTNSSSTIRGKLDKLKSLTKLTTLDLSGNDLTAFPSTTVGSMTKLQNLYLQDNAITSIPSTIGNLTALKVFHAADNRISSLSSSISKCKNLTKMDLSNNRLSKIPSLKALTKLKCTGYDYYALNLCGNKLSQSTIRANTSSQLSSAWVKRQTTKTFVPVSKIAAKVTMIPSGFSADLAGQFEIAPTNATYKNVKYAITSKSAGIKAELNGSTLSVEKTSDDVKSGYVFVTVSSLDGSGTNTMIYVQVL